MEHVYYLLRPLSIYENGVSVKAIVGETPPFRVGMDRLGCGAASVRCYRLGGAAGGSSGPQGHESTAIHRHLFAHGRRRMMSCLIVDDR